MKKALKIVGLVIFVAIIVFLILSYVGTRKNHAQIADLSDLKEEVTKNESAIRVNATLVDANTELVSKNTNLISANAVVIESSLKSIQKNSEKIKNNQTLVDQNSDRITENTQKIKELSEAQKELRGVVTAHGYKVNRLVWEMVFKIAYGDTPAARTKWNQYCGCGNKPLWEEAISKLNLVQVQKMLRLQKIEEEISETEDRLNQVKPRCFQR